LLTYSSRCTYELPVEKVAWNPRCDALLSVLNRMNISLVGDLTSPGVEDPQARSSSPDCELKSALSYTWPNISQVQSRWSAGGMRTLKFHFTSMTGTKPVTKTLKLHCVSKK